MQKNLILIIAIFVSYLLSAQPKLNFSDNKKNFGFVKRGELVVLKFDFKNSGTSPLIITETKVECSCTKISLPNKPILPNEKSELLVEFDTKTTYDRQDRTILIYSNDPESPRTIRFKGVVLRK